MRGRWEVPAARAGNGREYLGGALKGGRELIN